MQSRKEYIEILRKYLPQGLQGAETDYMGEKGNFHPEWFDNADSIMSRAGKEELYELIPDIFKMLNCKDGLLRGQAIITLSFDTRLQSPEAKDIAYKMWLEDEDEDVRERALRAWTAFYTKTKDPKVLKELYLIIMSKKYSVAHKFEALSAIFDITREPSKFYDPYSQKFCNYPKKTHEEFEQLVDWEEIKSILKKYAPNALK